MMTTVRSLLIGGALLLLSPASFAQEQALTYSRVKVDLTQAPGGLRGLAQLGIAVDHGEVKEGTHFISDLSELEIANLQANGYRLEVLIADVARHYVEQNLTPGPQEEHGERESCHAPHPFPVPENFTLGSMGGYYTWQEMLDILDDMATKYPHLISAKSPIGTTVEGRPIHFVRISNDPDTDQDKPEVFYNSLHHAREPASLSQVVYYMWHLLETYGTDPETTYLVDNTEMYFVPCVNPDGYVHNGTTNPSGGGMWRKNRRDNGDGTFGIDLNRNYGHFWGLDDTGSSPNPVSDVYRGPSAFSEPETQAIRDFCNARNFRLTLNYHTHGNLLIYPWGYQASYFTPDSALFVNFAQLLTRDNNYVYGTADQTVNYITNGSSDDWMYGEQTDKAKIYAMTPECGVRGEGFWPPMSRIHAISGENVGQNLWMAHLAGKYAVTKDRSPTVMTALDGDIRFGITRLGLESATFTVGLVPLENVVSAGPPRSFAGMAVLEERTDSIAITLDPAIRNGDTFRYVLTTSNGLYTHHDTMSKVFGSPVVLLADDATNLANWTTMSWGLTAADYWSPPRSITDSPNGNYANNANTQITLRDPIDLGDAAWASLRFMAKWAIEPGYDYVQVLASANGGPWTPLCGRYTKTGGPNQDTGEPVYDGQQSAWVEEEMGLNDFLGSSVRLRFRLVSDRNTTRDGFYFDDLTVTSIPRITTGMPQRDDLPRLSQNQPNPANGYTWINYDTDGASGGRILLHDAVGGLVREIPVNGRQGTVRVDTEGLGAGVYFYTIASGDRRAPAKRMVVVGR